MNCIMECCYTSLDKNSGNLAPLKIYQAGLGRSKTGGMSHD